MSIESSNGTAVERRVDAVVVGAGFGGLYMLHRLRKAGFNVHGFERGADVGGTWYWNRYPGARCDVESLDYSYSFNEDLRQEWQWTERFATQPEILRYLEHVADRFNLRSLISFGTSVETAQWSEPYQRWLVETDQGERLSVQYFILATGSLSAAKTPDIAGIESFAGKVYNTSSWPADGVDFAGQRVGVIGTGSSAIQAVPLIARQAAHLTVFQRTPAFTVPARNRELQPDEVRAFKRDYPTYRQRILATRQGVHFPTTGKSALDLSPTEREAVYAEAWQRGGPGFVQVFTDLLTDRVANETAAEFLRARIAEIVTDPVVADALTPRDYPIGSKRIAVDTGYYATFNRPNVTLENLRDAPIESVVAEGVQTTKSLVPLDALVLATGFDAMTGSFLRIDVQGRAGLPLREKWAAGPRTYLGLMSNGFPNMFMIAGPGSPSVLTNMVVSIEQHVDWITDCLVTMRDRSEQSIEPFLQVEDEWVESCNRAAERTLFMAGDSWYLGANVPGKPRVFMPYLGGVAVYRDICAEIAQNGYRGFSIKM